IVWDADSCARQLVLDGHAAGLKQAAFSPDGRYVVTASEDATAWLWDAATGRPVARWRGHHDVVFGVAFDRAGRRAVTAGDDGTAIVWNVRPQEEAVWLPSQP